jgi:hypothetical protein
MTGLGISSFLATTANHLRVGPPLLLQGYERVRTQRGPYRPLKARRGIGRRAVGLTSRRVQPGMLRFAAMSRDAAGVLRATRMQRRSARSTCNPDVFEGRQGEFEWAYFADLDALCDCMSFLPAGEMSS